MNKIDKLPDEYIDASIVTTLLWDKIGELIEWQNEMVELIKWSEVHMKPFTVEANTPQEPKIEVDPLYYLITAGFAIYGWIEFMKWVSKL